MFLIILFLSYISKHSSNGPMFTVLLGIFLSVSIVAPFGDECDSVMCSNIFDYVCGEAVAADGTRVFIKYQNICHMRKIQCRVRPIVEIYQTSDDECNITKNYNGRRVHDFSIVGAHQACNHTCPTYCIDTYEPVCAQIWKPNMQKFNTRPMINHCHVDLFSCAIGVNVTIHPLGKCYKNPSGLLFMTQVAALKSLKLIDDIPMENSPGKFPQAITSASRRSNNQKRIIQQIFRILLKAKNRRNL